MPDSTSPLYLQEEKTEVTCGIEKIKQRTLERFSSTRDKVDSCIDPLNPPTIMNAKPIVDAIKDLYYIIQSHSF
jgi:hypothetical protein